MTTAVPNVCIAECHIELGTREAMELGALDWDPMRPAPDAPDCLDVGGTLRIQRMVTEWADLGVPANYLVVFMMRIPGLDDEPIAYGSQNMATQDATPSNAVSAACDTLQRVWGDGSRTGAGHG